MEWKRFNGQNLEFPIEIMVESAIIHEISLGNKLKICIGSDSKIKEGIIEFATVIVFLREKKGGYLYFNKVRSTVKMSLKERMIAEVSSALSR